VLAEPYELLQVFLNLSQNSLRAAQDVEDRELSIRVVVNGGSVTVLVEDSGPGIADPSVLFQAFQRGADSNGLGLYISRALVRTFNGDLRYLESERGARFAIDLLAAHPASVSTQ
jgi:C4-dicarboxylate-specific signal transduction histidine kinase